MRWNGWKTDLAKSVSKIDKATGITQNSLDILVGDFQEHKEDNKDWQGQIAKEVKNCPETSHIEIQNGKLDDMCEKLDIMWSRLIKILIGTVMFICAIIGGMAAWKEIFSG